MIYQGLFLSSIGALLGFLLLLRLRRARAAVRSATAIKGQTSELLDGLRRTLDDLIDRDLLAQAGPRGLAEVAIRFREVHDASDVDGLLAAIAKKAESRTPSDLIELIKYLFMLQYSLDLPIAEFDPCVRRVVDRLENLEFLGARIAKATIPREGEVFDAKTMWALKSGTRVKQPMGVTLKDESGRVLSKCKVLCQ